MEEPRGQEREITRRIKRNARQLATRRLEAKGAHISFPVSSAKLAAASIMEDKREPLVALK